MHGSTTAQWITAIAALVALVGAGVTIIDNRRTARRRTTYEYIARLEDPTLIEHQALMSALLRGCLRPPGIAETEWAGMDEEARRDTASVMWRHLRSSASLDDRETLLRLLVYPNMLEGLAGMYNHGLLDRQIVKTSVESEAREFWELAARSWLGEFRSGLESNVWRDLEVMIEDLAKRKRPKWHHKDGPE